MNCKNVTTLIQDYLEGLLGGDTAGEVRRHISSCQRCAEEFRDYQTVGSMLDELEMEQVPRGFREGVITQLKAAGRIFESETARSRAWHRILGALRPAVHPLAASAVFLFALIGAIIGVGMIKGVVGKGTVIATNTYLGIEDTLGNVGLLDRLFDNLEKNVRMLKTLLSAVLSILTTAADTYMLPVLVVMTVLMLGVAWYVRNLQRRSSHNASHVF